MGIEGLDSDDLTRWETAKAAARDLAAASSDDEIAAAVAAAAQAAKRLDLAAIRDALHVPDDAGEYEDALREMLLRIPDGWGRWISCGKGWYPILADLHRELILICPGYELHQVKEKFGGLRFYWSPGTDELSDAEEAAARELVSAAEQRAAETCEMCGQGGAHMTYAAPPSSWQQNLCSACAVEHGRRVSGSE